MLRWRRVDWHTRERMRSAGLLNGCGAKGWAVRPPEKLYHASCDHHDFNYWLGGTAYDRAKADRQFLAAMLQDAAGSPWPLRWVHYARAAAYYAAVRLFGGSHFSWGPVKTREDLLAELEEAEASA